MKSPDNNETDHYDPDTTEVIRVPAGAFDAETVHAVDAGSASTAAGSDHPSTDNHSDEPSSADAKPQDELADHAVDPEATQVIRFPDGTFDGEDALTPSGATGVDDTAGGDGSDQDVDGVEASGEGSESPDDPADHDSETDAEEDEDFDEDSESLLQRLRYRAGEFFSRDDIRRHLPYAAVAAAVVIGVVGVWVANAESGTAGEVSDASDSSEVSGTQSFEDLSGLFTDDFAETTPLESSESSSVSVTPSDVPLPGEDPGLTGLEVDPFGPSTVTITDSAPLDPINGDPLTTETTTFTETSAPSTITETPAGPSWPNVSLNGSVSVQPPGPGHTPADPSTVTVVVPPESTEPSTVTVIVTPSTTSTPAKTSTPKPTKTSTVTPTQCSTPSKTKTTTPRPTTTVRPTKTTTPPTTTSKKPTPTKTTAPPCK